MIIHHSGRLHESVANGRANELPDERIEAVEFLLDFEESFRIANS